MSLGAQVARKKAPRSFARSLVKVATAFVHVAFIFAAHPTALFLSRGRWTNFVKDSE
jgi:hypothetical protein